MSEPAVAWVVPCFNEAERLDPAAFVALVRDSAPASLVLVDDGSSDETLAILRTLARQAGADTEIVALPSNGGKAEAVRQGLRRALHGHAEIVGYVDADLATPPGELARLATLARNGHYDLLMGSRVQLLGRTIERSHLRHYLGRVFATAASLSLRLPVYDTQCGAKLFRRTPALVAAVAQPFTSHWAFDVELIARLLHPPTGVMPIAVERIREEPLLTWADVPGSKLRPAAALRAGIDLLLLGLRRRL
jgi:glycosyltransferase involved in cell wall biosynthesis